MVLVLGTPVGTAAKDGAVASTVAVVAAKEGPVPRLGHPRLLAFRPVATAVDAVMAMGLPVP